VPVNVVPSQGKPAHWVLYAVDLNGGGIYIYDSLSGYAEEEQNKLLTSLVDFLRDLGIENPKWTIFTVFDKPLQEDATSCGVYLTVFVEGFLQGFKNWDKLQKVKNMNRLRYLLQYQILLKEFLSVEDLVPK